MTNSPPGVQPTRGVKWLYGAPGHSMYNHRRPPNDPKYDCRGGLPHSTVHTLAATRNLARPPRPATIDALAKGLDVPVSAVRAAAAESTGLHYYDEPPAGRDGLGDRERELLIASIDELTPEDRRHVAALVESLRKKTSPPPDEHLTPPPGTAGGPRPGDATLIPRAPGAGQEPLPWPAPRGHFCCTAIG